MKIFEKDGLKYIDEGKGEIILLLHGWGVSPNALEQIINPLADKHRVVAPFFKSFRHFKNEEEKIRSLFGKEKIIVVGHSAGGIAAFNYSVNYSDFVKALIMVDTVGAFKDKSILKYVKNWCKLALKIIFHFDHLTSVLAKDVFNQVFHPFNLLKDAGFVINYDIKFMPSFPVLILWGKEDDLINIENGYNLQKLIKGSKFKVVEGNHYWFLTNPKVLLTEIDDFISTI